MEHNLLNDFQHSFPLTAAPFEEIAKQLDAANDEVLASLQRLTLSGSVSRIGAVIRPHRIGVSTLAAMAVPAARLTEVAQIVNGYVEVNHNYEREHHFSLWFVATAPHAAHLEQTLADIEARTGIAVMRLPMLEDYHIDLGFDLSARVGHGTAGKANKGRFNDQAKLDAEDYALIAAIQAGLPLVSRPYAAIGHTIGMTESDVLARLKKMLEQDVIKRFGIIVRHHELGFRSNAMVVWDVPDTRIAELGHCIGSSGLVNLCYQRPRRLPDWHYNLFCMIHGRDRAGVLERLELLCDQCGLSEFTHEILFSRQRFKQCGANYVMTPASELQVA